MGFNNLSLPLAAMLFIFLFFFNTIPCLALSGSIPFLYFEKLQIPLTSGPEALAFDLKGRGPYTGVADGRVLKYQGSKLGFVDFATTSPLRTKEKCDGNSDPDMEPICGRPLGLAFDYLSGKLYMVDPHLGLFVVGSKGGLATHLPSGSRGKPFDFLDAIDVDPTTGVVYFADSGGIFWQSLSFAEIIASNDTSARLLKYDPKTKQVTVVLKGLSGAAGVAVSEDGKYVLVTELIASRICKYWIKGPRAKSSETLIKFNGYPDNIKRTTWGDFWVAANMQKGEQISDLVPTGLKINGKSGKVLVTLKLDKQYNSNINEVQEFGGALYIASASTNFVGVVKGVGHGLSAKEDKIAYI